jgi:coenzyme F420-0:L-glutamate ligase/coenzyme F420-1:gamma-L-glutamate ligase
MKKFEVYSLSLPIIEAPVEIVEVIASYLEEESLGLEDRDVLVITSKYVLKARGEMVKIDAVMPGFRAKLISRITGKPPREVQMILDASRKVLFYASTGFMVDHAGDIGKNVQQATRAARSEPSILFTVTKNGFVTTDSGLDYSNVPPGYAVVNTADFDSIAKEIRSEIRDRFGVDVAVVITDTEFTISNGKFGTLDFAVGASGIAPITREFGELDLYGRPKFGGLDIVVDEVSATAALMMKQASEGVPAVLIRGLQYERSDEGVTPLLVSNYGGTARRVILKGVFKNLLAKLFRII